MKLFVIVFLLLIPSTDLDKIAKANKAKKEAEKAFISKNYTLAQTRYRYILDSLGIDDERVRLNLAHVQYFLNDTTNAIDNYQNLTESDNPVISSLANQQLGELKFENKKYKEALSYYKQAIKQDFRNEDARYNYELLKKIVKEQEKQKDKQKSQDKNNKDQQKKDQQNKDKQNKDQQSKDQKDHDQQKKDKKDQKNADEEKQNQQQEKQEKKNQQNKGEEKKEEQSQPSTADKLKKMNISEEKAKMILEAMKNNEIQYIQQNKRKSKKKKDSGKPDW